MIIDMLDTVIGTCPPDMYILRYVIAGLFFLVVTKSFIMMFSIPFKQMKM